MMEAGSVKTEKKKRKEKKKETKEIAGIKQAEDNESF